MVDILGPDLFNAVHNVDIHDFLLRNRFHRNQWINDDHTYFTLLGDEEGCPRPVLDLHMNEPIDHFRLTYNEENDYLRLAMRHARGIRPNLNFSYKVIPDEKKAALYRFFEMPQDFIRTFTERWGVVTVMQWDKTTGKYYLLVIVHNGVWNEVELFTHLSGQPGDSPNFMLYEITNYFITANPTERDYARIPMGRWNIAFNDHTAAMQDLRIFRYHPIMYNKFTDFHRSLQYMLLSFYVTQDIFKPADPAVVQITDYAWYDQDKHDYIQNNISHGDTINALMEITDEEITDAGVVRKVQNIISTNPDHY